ncbi:MAG: DUF3617 domain-containing protein [Nitrosomonas sp.]|nr:MAG: DUF3617 domain-containing protein [Nitrosomonas sp.]
MRKILTATLASLILTAPSLAHEHIRPGLWEITTKSDLLALIPHIPSEHMQQLNDLANRYGLKLPSIEGNTAVSKICITPDMASQEIPAYFYENRSGCTIQNATRTGNSYKLDLVCNQQHFQGNGTAQGKFTSPENFSGSTEFDSSVSGHPVFASAETTGRWIGEHCIAVNPLQ